jgi:hypothetical protein
MLAPLTCYSFSDESSSSSAMLSVFLRWKWAWDGGGACLSVLFFLSGCLTGWLSGVEGLVGAAAACAVGRLVGRSLAEEVDQRFVSGEHGANKQRRNSLQ